MFTRMINCAVAATAVVAIAGTNVGTSGQAAITPTNDAPNSYVSHESYFKLPEGRTWGSTSAIDIDKDGQRRV